MKKVLWLVAFWIVSITAFSQAKTTHKDEDNRVYTWTQLNAGEWSSFWWTIKRSSQRHHTGYYWYYVYLSSNSYFSDETKATTYITDLVLTAIEDGDYETVRRTTESIIVDWNPMLIYKVGDKSGSMAFDLDWQSCSSYSPSSVGLENGQYQK